MKKGAAVYGKQFFIIRPFVMCDQICTGIIGKNSPLSSDYLSSAGPLFFRSLCSISLFLFDFFCLSLFSLFFLSAPFLPFFFPYFFDPSL